MISSWEYKEEYKFLRSKIIKSVDLVLKSGQLFFGKETEKFEKNFANGVKGRRHYLN